MTDADLIEICREFRAGLIGETGDSAGCCAKISLALAGALRFAYGIDCECVQTDLSDNPNSEWYDHVWIRLADGRVLDATFDQFCSEESMPVYLGAPTEFHAVPVGVGGAPLETA